MPSQAPNFFIVGAPKAGTTSLYSYLGQHPQVFTCPIKEPNFFAPELGIDNVSRQMRPHMARKIRRIQQYAAGDAGQRAPEGSGLSWQAYLRLYRDVSEEIAIGEASAAYLWSKTAARNIAVRIPNARIIISLRNPVERAFSQYLQMLGAGMIHRSFREQIRADLQCREKKIGTAWPLLELGQYYEQVQRYFAQFRRAQVHIVYHEDLAHAPQAVLSALFAFLGVDPDFVPDMSQHHNVPQILRLNGVMYLLKKSGAWDRVRRVTPSPVRSRLRARLLRPRESLRMETVDRAFLTDFYRNDICKLATLLDRDLTAWLDPSSRTTASSQPG